MKVLTSVSPTPKSTLSRYVFLSHSPCQKMAVTATVLDTLLKTLKPFLRKVDQSRKAVPSLKANLSKATKVSK